MLNQMFLTEQMPLIYVDFHKWSMKCAGCSFENKRFWVGSCLVGPYQKNKENKKIKSVRQVSFHKNQNILSRIDHKNPSFVYSN